MHERIGDIEVDFLLEREGKRLVVEVDGSQHEQAATADRGRDAFLISQGYDVLRVSARDVMETPALVLRQISDRLAGVLPPEKVPRAESETLGGPRRAEAAVESDGEVRFDPELFPPDWLHALETVAARGWQVLPGEDLIESERVIGGSVVMCSRDGVTVYGVDELDAQPSIKQWAESRGKLVVGSPEVLTGICD